MTAPTIKHPVPYYSQWESAGLVPDFVTGTRDAATDPLWMKSGADTPQEYAFWAPRMCGVACLRMALDFWGHPVPPSVPLVHELVEAGAYVREGDTVKGLIYQPFARHVTARWGIEARSVPDLPVSEIQQALDGGALVMLSVHKTIRTLDPTPAGKGGHLVLAVGATPDHVLVNNPSGFPTNASQQSAPVPWSDLGRFYAGRGIILEGGLRG
ncbi:C39 family peptidase [Streptomyces sp. BPTC-684]|uniref:C39 family peptidase n=1 Tax=Streptomyces sp. BPTC-684 TaxID=3043734 RepID=UPI0024B183BA|nr:C39 family peptidase [Streptomyces sp. BPTC-684]WHM36608.1 C39 family peptidase [Streptomyces sp. BPTC-684]